MIKQSEMKTKNSGFTLVELITVIAILGILAAVAFPSFTNLSSNASAGTLASIAGAITSADKVNKTTMKALQTGISIPSSTGTCASAAASLLDGGIPSGYAVTPTTAFGANTSGVGQTCTLTYSATGQTATFTVTPTS